MELRDILSQESVLVCTDIKTKRDVLTKLSDKVAALTGQPAAEIFEALNDRESLGSTGLGNGIAVPHGKYAPLKGVMAVFMRLPSPVDFESVDDQPVDIVMMLLAPMGAGADHLKALARVARVLRTDSVADALRHSSDPATLYRILTQPLESTRAA
ncbi:MAG TPA: PTS sugar transporter subunit IIA [Devosia sp.]|nr:PTS sugar transporter subunit IIA [Devosia sp.]